MYSQTSPFEFSHSDLEWFDEKQSRFVIMRAIFNDGVLENKSLQKVNQAFGSNLEVEIDYSNYISVLSLLLGVYFSSRNQDLSRGPIRRLIGGFSDFGFKIPGNAEFTNTLQQSFPPSPSNNSVQATLISKGISTSYEFLQPLIPQDRLLFHIVRLIRHQLRVTFVAPANVPKEPNDQTLLDYPFLPSGFYCDRQGQGKFKFDHDNSENQYDTSLIHRPWFLRMLRKGGYPNAISTNWFDEEVIPILGGLLKVNRKTALMLGWGEIESMKNEMVIGDSWRINAFNYQFEHIFRIVKDRVFTAKEKSQNSLEWGPIWEEIKHGKDMHCHLQDAAKKLQNN